VLGLTKDCSDYMLPKKFAISSAAFDATEGYLTPTYKIKRNKVYADMKEDLNQLYNNEDEFLVINRRMTVFYDQSAIFS
jgi:long-subunit acyl-CoA synthetase (AMP-forming)